MAAAVLGLLAAVRDGVVRESTGRCGRSVPQRYALGADAPEARVALPADLFGEGIRPVGQVRRRPGDRDQ